MAFGPIQHWVAVSSRRAIRQARLPAFSPSRPGREGRIPSGLSQPCPADGPTQQPLQLMQAPPRGPVVDPEVKSPTCVSGRAAAGPRSADRRSAGRRRDRLAPARHRAFQFGLCLFHARHGPPTYGQERRRTPAQALELVMSITRTASKRGLGSSSPNSCGGQSARGLKWGRFIVLHRVG